jgi:hypothetical protein
MPSLRELQSRVMSCLLGGSTEDLSQLIHARGITTGDRLRIYRQNVIENFTESLRSSFPVTVRLVGEDYFRDAARRLQQTQPSSSGDLANVGAAFPGFLQQRHQSDRFCYLADVARFEWLCQTSKLAAEHACLDLTKLASVPPADYDGLHLVLHPSVNLFESPYPCLQIWQSHLDERIDNDSIDLDSGGVRVAIASARHRLTFLSLSKSESIFLDALRSDCPLCLAVEAAISADPAFDVAEVLRRYVMAHVIVDFHPAGTATGNSSGAAHDP